MNPLIRRELSASETCIVNALLAPYGIEKTTTEILLDSAGQLNSKKILSQLEILEMRGYLKSREVVLPCYLVARRVWQLDHKRLHKDSKDRLRTRLILSSILKFILPS